MSSGTATKMLCGEKKKLASLAMRRLQGNEREEFAEKASLRSDGEKISSTSTLSLLLTFFSASLAIQIQNPRALLVNALPASTYCGQVNRIHFVHGSRRAMAAPI